MQGKKKFTPKLFLNFRFDKHVPQDNFYKILKNHLDLRFTIKRQWGFTHTQLKGLKKVNGEFGLILLCYNLERLIAILGKKGLKEATDSNQCFQSSLAS